MEEIRKAKIKAMHILARMDKTESDLQAGLKRTGFSDEAVTAAIEYVKSYGYIDDQKYAQKYVSFHKDRKSRKKIKYDLINKGVSREQIDLAFEQCEEYNEREALRKAIYKKWKKEERPDEKELHKLFSALARQGFSSYDIWQVLQEENLT